VRLGGLLVGQQLAVDLGTANTVVFRRGEGIVLFEPSVVAIDERTGRVQAVGEQARQMIGRTPAHITARRPLRHGVVADFEATEQMLRHFIRAVGAGRGSRAHVVVCVPSGITEVERNAVVDAARSAGALRAFLIEEPLAGAIGAGLPVAEPVGSLVVDVGGGTSEVGQGADPGICHVRSVHPATETLTQMKCVACRKDEPTVTDAEIAEFHPEVPDWEIMELDGIKRLRRIFLDDCAQALEVTSCPSCLSA
jgi:rod shape-determining protein MreB and related proteins